MARKKGKSDQAHVWTTNDLILDALFALLPTTDLLNIRRTCKQWAKAGGRELGKRSAICFTDSKFAGTADFSIRFFNACTRSYLWECHCSRLKFFKRFISTDGGNYQTMFVWDSEFQPSTCSILGCETLMKLSQTQASKITSLQLIKIPFFEVSSVLRSVHILFKNLRHLEIREIDVKAERTHDVDQNLHRNRNTTTSSSTLEGNGSCSNLESLIIEISPHWIETSWKFLIPHVKLQRLEINWYKSYPRRRSGATNRLQGKTDHYGRTLESMLSSKASSAFIAVTQVSLRFELTTANRMSAQTFLNQLRSLTKLSLQVQGPFVELEQLLVGLNSTAVEALESIHIANLFSLSDQGQMPEFSQLFTTLAQMGYFGKPKWTFVCRAMLRGWVRLIKTITKLTFQLQGFLVEKPPFFQVIEAVLGRQSYFPQNYNYAYHKVLDVPKREWTNDYENFNASTFFKAYLLKARWKAIHKSVCKACRNGPRLLADLLGFRSDVGYNFNFSDDHSAEYWIRTWTFMFVPPEILAKWRVQLVSEIATAKGNQQCRCRWWDIVTRMKQGEYDQSSFTDKEDHRFPDYLNSDQLESLACLST